MARKGKKAPDPGGPSVPAYIVTFSDMVTLLLTFFVMLLSLAQVQDPELFNNSRDAFTESINNFGLGMLMGKRVTPEFGNLKMKYHIPDPDKENEPARTIDSREEELRRLFRKVTESMQVTPPRIDVRLSDYSATTIHFPQGQTKLDANAEKYLTQFAAKFQTEADAGIIELYVLGVAADEPTEKQQCVISSLRAQKVANFLEQTGLHCPIYSWGTGGGGFWADSDSPVSKEAQIFIAVTRPGD